MTDISLIPILKSEGWKVMTRAKLKSMKKEELIETIETLENNYRATIERANNSYNYGKSEIERLEKENAELKAQIKLIESVSDANADENAELKANQCCNVSEKGLCLADDRLQIALKDNEQLKAQIEKMKCCGNCIYFMYGYCMTDESCHINNEYKKWELAE